MPANSKYTEDFKVRVAEATLEDGSTLKSIGEKFGVHPTLVRNWKLKYIDHSDGSETIHASVDDSESQKFKLSYKRIFVDSADIEDEIKELVESGDFSDAINAVFVISNGSFYEIFDDSVDDEVEAIETKITNLKYDDTGLSIDAEFLFEFSMLTEMDQESIEEWQDENESLAFGVSVSVVSDDGEEELNIETFDDFRATLV